MPEYCRFCAKELGSLSWSRCLKVSNQYLIMFESFTKYIDTNDTLLPKTACDACFNVFKLTESFYNKVKHSQNVLNKLYKSKDLQLQINSGVKCNTELREDCVDNSIEQKETLPTSISNSPPHPHTQNANVLTDNTIFLHKKFNITDCFVMLDKLEFNPRGSYDSSLFNDMEDSIKHYSDGSMSEDNVICHDYNKDNRHNITEDYVFGTVVVKERCNSDSEASLVLCRGDGDYVDNVNVLENTHTYNDSNHTNVLNTSSIKIEPTDDSWTGYKWVCCHCKTEFENMKALRTHSKETHAICYGFKCMDCDKQYNAFNSFIEHVRQHRDILRNYCQYCNLKFEECTTCEEHIIDHHWASREKICLRCGEILPNAAALDLHEKKNRQFCIPEVRVHKLIVPDSEYNGTSSWEDYQWDCQIRQI